MLEIHHGPAEREIATRLDGDMDALSADDRRIDQEVTQTASCTGAEPSTAMGWLIS
jgi:hypothetical protein